MKATAGFKFSQTLWLLIGLFGLWVATVKAQEVTVSPPLTALDKIIAAGVIRIAVPNDLPPFGSSDANGKLGGYDIDVANLLAEDLGVRLRLVPVISVNRIPALMGATWTW